MWSSPYPSNSLRWRYRINGSYNLLFAAASEALRTIAADLRHLGADIGFLAVLHTWDQTLRHHPHLHCVVPGGGLSVQGESWRSCRRGFFLPVNVLARLFRRLFLEGLARAYEKGKLGFHGACAFLAQPTAFSRLLKSVRAREWWVYAKRLLVDQHKCWLTSAATPIAWRSPIIGCCR